jgi:hypothetical protein
VIAESVAALPKEPAPAAEDSTLPGDNEVTGLQGLKQVRPIISSLAFRRFSDSRLTRLCSFTLNS